MAQQSSAYAQGQNPPPGAYPQGQPVAYPQGQPVVYAQGQQGVVYPNQQVIVTPGPPTVYQTGTTQGDCCGSGISDYYNAQGGLGTGVTHLVVSVLSIILGGIAYVFSVGWLGVGIWSAIIFFIPTGILGVLSKNKGSGVIIGYMVMSILTAFEAFGMLVFEAFVAAAFTYLSVSGVIINSLLALVALAEFINAIVSAAYCCNGHACCCAPSSATTTTTTTTTTYGQPQAQPMTVVVGPGGK